MKIRAFCATRIAMWATCASILLIVCTAEAAATFMVDVGPGSRNSTVVPLVEVYQIL